MLNACRLRSPRQLGWAQRGVPGPRAPRESALGWGLHVGTSSALPAVLPATAGGPLPAILCCRRSVRPTRGQSVTSRSRVSRAAVRWCPARWCAMAHPPRPAGTSSQGQGRREPSLLCHPTVLQPLPRDGHRDGKQARRAQQRALPLRVSVRNMLLEAPCVAGAAGNAGDKSVDLC